MPLDVVTSHGEPGTTGHEPTTGGTPASETRARTFRWLNWALSAAAFVFVVWAGRDLLARWEPGGVHVRLDRLALAVVVWTAAQIVQAWAWTGLLVQLTGESVHRLRAVALHLASQLGRYLPGKVGLPAIRVSGAVSLGVRPTAVGASVLLEILAWLSVGLTMTLVALLSVAPEDLPEAIESRLDLGVGLAIGCGLGLVALATVDRRILPLRFLRLLRLEGQGALLSFRPLATYSLSWALVFVHGAICSWAVSADWRTAWMTAPMYPLAQLGGFLAIPVPAGVGVREAILSLSTEDTLGTAAAVSAGLLSRITWVLGEILGWSVTLVLAGGSTVRSSDAK